MLVNNAGITRDAMLHRMKPEQWTAVINTNLGSLFNMTRQVIEGMRERKFGRIVNISSINGQKGQMGQTNYSAAKAGELGFTKALAQEGARKGITVNAICPGYIDTEMVQAVPKDVLEKIICRRSRSAASASRRRSRAAWCSWPPTTPASSPARRSPPMAGSISRNRCHHPGQREAPHPESRRHVLASNLRFRMRAQCARPRNDSSIERLGIRRTAP